MPARSRSQQRLFGMVHAYNKGELKGSKSLKKRISSIADNISDEDARHFAETPHKGLPEKKGEIDMSKKCYIRGFFKVAEEHGENPYVLARFAAKNKLLKKAESKAFINNLKRMISMKKCAQQASSAVPAQSLVATSTSKMSMYNRFRDKALKGGWKYDNGVWTSPKGNRYTDKDIKKRILERNNIRKFNSNAVARQYAVGVSPYKNTDPNQRISHMRNLDPKTDLGINALTSSTKKVNATVNGQKVYKYDDNSGYYVKPKGNSAAYNGYGDNLVPVDNSGREDSLPVIVGNRIYQYKNGKLVPSGKNSITMQGQTLDNYGNAVKTEVNPIRMTRARAEAVRNRRNGFTA